MRVLLFSAADLSMGGDQSVRGRLIAAGLRDAGAAVSVVSPATPSVFMRAGLTSETLDLSASCVNQLDAAVDRAQPDVIVGLTAAGADIVADVARRSGLMLAFDYPGTDRILDAHAVHGERRPSSRLGRAARWLKQAGRADVVTCAQPALVTSLQHLVNRHTVALAGITDVDAFAPDVVDTAPRKGVHVLVPSGLPRHDGLDLMSAVIVRLAARGDEFQFIVRASIGSDPIRLREWFARTDARVTLADETSPDGIAHWYRQVDVVVLPRPWTLMTHLDVPQALLDGMAAGRAIVATDLASHRWALEPGSTGLLCRPTVEALTTALLECRDRDRRIDLGSRARQQAIARFCHRRQSERLLDVLDRARARVRATKRPATPPRVPSLRARDFASTPASDRTRILFVGPPESSHTRAWIDLFPVERFDVRLFSTTNKVPPTDWRVHTYVAPEDDLIESADLVNMRSAGIGRRRMRRTAVTWVERLHGRRMQQLARRIRRGVADGVVVYGAGQAGELLLTALRREGVNVTAVVDSNPSMWGRKLHGVDIMPLQAVIDAGGTTFAVGSFAHRVAMARAIRDAMRATGRQPRLFLPRASWTDARVRMLSRWTVRLAHVRRTGPATPPWRPEDARGALASIVAAWQPAIVQTISLDAGLFFQDARRAWPLLRQAAWVLQLWGGSDLMQARFEGHDHRPWLDAMLACDEILTDNVENPRIVANHGVPARRFSPIGPVPVTGGLDLDDLAAGWHGAPSTRRAILWPKAYDCPWSKGLPVLDALVAAWPHLGRPDIHLLASTPEMRMWVRTLPADIQGHIAVHERLPHAEALRLMQSARVLLAPSLVDGVPNVLQEAMACGAVPIVSPLPTITPVVKDGEHVLFARNLYVEELTAAIVRGMTDDALVDDIAQRNLHYVRDLADRSDIRCRVVDRYDAIVQARTANRQTTDAPHDANPARREATVGWVR